MRRLYVFIIAILVVGVVPACSSPTGSQGSQEHPPPAGIGSTTGEPASQPMSPAEPANAEQTTSEENPDRSTNTVISSIVEKHNPQGSEFCQEMLGASIQQNAPNLALRPTDRGCRWVSDSPPQAIIWEDGGLQGTELLTTPVIESLYRRSVDDGCDPMPFDTYLGPGAFYVQSSRLASDGGFVNTSIDPMKCLDQVVWAQDGFVMSLKSIGLNPTVIAAMAGTFQHPNHYSSETGSTPATSNSSASSPIITTASTGPSDSSNQAPGTSAPTSGKALWADSDLAEFSSSVMECVVDDAPPLVWESRYHDYTGDGQPEAILAAQCPAHTSQNSIRILVFDGSSTREPKPLGDLAGEERYIELATLDVDGEHLIVGGLGRSPDAPSCCPDQGVVITYAWSGTAFEVEERHDEPVREQAPRIDSSSAGFVTPSGNIVCAPLDPTSSTGGIECNVNTATYPVPDCEGTEPGNVWALSGLGPLEQDGPNGCRGDRVQVRDPLTAEYGTVHEIGGVSCAVDETGVTCTNLDGHGFKIARESYDIF